MSKQKHILSCVESKNNLVTITRVRSHGIRVLRGVINTENTTTPGGFPAFPLLENNPSTLSKHHRYSKPHKTNLLMLYKLILFFLVWGGIIFTFKRFKKFNLVFLYSVSVKLNDRNSSQVN